MPTPAEFSVHKPQLQVRVKREFNAPRSRVWDVINDPKLIPEWWGPERFATKVDQMDVRVGGKWRYIHKDGQQEFAFNGVYKAIEAPHKIVMTFEFEPMPGHINVQTMVLTELPHNRTLMDVTVQFDNLADLEGMVGSGMKEGNLESYDRLDKVLAKAQN